MLTGVERQSGVPRSVGGAKARDRQRFKILLVEDNPGDAGLIKEALKGRNRFELTCVDCFSAALAHLKGSPTDVVLLDLALPDSHGLDTLDKMRANAGSTPIVILTGSDDDDLAVSALRRGAQDYLVKGQVDGGLLARLLVYAIERWRAEERLSASETRADAVLKTALDAIVSMDCTGRIIEFNHAAETTFGYARAEVLGQVLADVLLPPALRDAHRTGLERYLVTGKGAVIGKRVELSALRRDGTEFPVELSIARVGSATPPTFTAFIRDISERKHAEKALLESETRYRRIVETTSEGVWLLDAETKTTFMNTRMAEMLGYDVGHVVGLSPAKLLDEDGLVVLAESFQAFKAGVSKQVDVQYKRKDGSTFWARLEMSPILDSAGRFDGALAMVRDISARRKTEDELRASEFRFRRLWDSGLILISISDTLGNISDVNEAGARMLGYSRAELLSGNVHWQELTPPEWKQADEAALVQLKTTGVAAPWEKELSRKDGSRLPILTGAAMLAGSEGISIAIDLSERKRAQNANFERMRIASLTAEVGMAFTQGGSLQNSLQRCAAAIVEYLGAAFAGIWTFDSRGKVLELQASDGPHSGVPVGKFQIDYIVEERTPHVTNDVLNDPRIIDLAWARREGMVAFAGHPLLVGGELVGVVAMFARQSLTETVLKGMGSIADEIAIGVHRSLGERIRGSLEDQLRQAQKMEAVGRLAGGVAHDFNNVLSVILCYAEMMHSALEPGDPMRGDVEEVQKAGKRAADLTRQLLMFSRQQVLEPKVLDLNDVLSGMHKMLARILGADVEMMSLAGEGLGRVRADPSSIEQVIMNLVVNARDAMPTGGQLTIETANADLDDDFARRHVGVKAGPHVVLTVSDSGIGMDMVTQARVFEPFFTTKPKEKGTGLGLSTVFGIAQQSGGGVWVHSELGKGTTFKVYLPRVDERIDTTRPPAPPAALHGSETILLVEDDDQVRLVAVEILRRHGYQVIEARHAGEALLYCEQHAGTIHLLLTDVVMPQMSGPELARRLATDRPTMRVVCMSGYMDDSIVRHGVLEAEIAYLQKPITPQTLTRKVRQVLDSATFATPFVGRAVRPSAAPHA